jgi:hypothetical protein
VYFLKKFFSFVMRVCLDFQQACYYFHGSYKLVVTTHCLVTYETILVQGIYYLAGFFFACEICLSTCRRAEPER